MADLHSKILDAPPRGPNSFNFVQFLGKFGKIVCWRPPGELAPPPRGNPGSATVNIAHCTSASVCRVLSSHRHFVIFYCIQGPVRAATNPCFSCPSLFDIEIRLGGCLYNDFFGVQIDRST